MSDIRIIGAAEGNLKNISLDIPRNKLVVFTGLSGSGKSTLLIDVLYNECQRQYLEAMAFQGIHKPKVERVRGASPAIVITQTDANRNPRSTVGTMSDIYTDLRMVYEKLGSRRCPYCGELISAAGCREETEKKGNDFYVYMYCCKCGRRMDKITRTYFSFNTREGACPTCEGLGRIHAIKKERTVDEKLSLEDGAVKYWEKQYGKYQLSVLHQAFSHYGVPVEPGTLVEQFDDKRKAILYYGVESDEVKQAFPHITPPKNTAAGRFEGVYPILWRRLADKDGDVKQLEDYFEVKECPDCRGERLCELSRRVTVQGLRLPQLSLFSLDRLYAWVRELHASLDEKQMEFVRDYLTDMETKISRFLKVGLGYLSLDRQTVTLSGGELQRLRLAAALDSEITGLIYILDEPTAGLHPKDTAGLVAILKRLRDLDNTVLVIEHDVDVIASADYLVDIGPGSGKFGGEIVAEGTLEEIKQQKESVTGRYLCRQPAWNTRCRKPAGAVRIENADMFNLKQLCVDIPTGCLVGVTGPSGSGKSTLVFEVLAKGRADTQKNRVLGKEQFNRVVEIGQASISRMKRSNVATYTEVYTEIRAVFAGTQAAVNAGFSAKHFSFNTAGGRCGNCEGLGYVDNNMLFFANTQVVCPVCGGNRFKEEILAVKYKGLSVKEVLDLSVDEAAEFFSEQARIRKTLSLLQAVGLGYLQLGQSLTTLSGGEGQRLKLARELVGTPQGRRSLYLMDEPTTGLHPQDIDHFLVLLNRLADAGNTVVVVEHNQQLIRSCDWVIDLGPEGGEKGGCILFEGTPEELKRAGHTATAEYL